MENQTSFDLSAAIQKWRRNLAQSAALRSADLDELEAHLRDAIPALQAAGYVQFLRPPTDGRFTYGRFRGNGLNGDSVPPTVIPGDAYFLLGDNRDNSADSRFMGPVQRRQFLGKAKVIYFSSDPETHKPRWNRIGKTPN